MGKISIDPNETLHDDEIKPLQDSYLQARHRVKKWYKQTRIKIEDKVKKELTDEYLKKLKKDNPDKADKIKELSEADQTVVNE